MSQDDKASSQQFFGTLVGQLVDATTEEFPKLVATILREILEGGRIAEEAASSMLSQVLDAPKRPLRLAAAHLLLRIGRNVNSSLRVVMNDVQGKPLLLPRNVAVVESIARLRAGGFPQNQLAEALVPVAVANFGGQRRAAMRLLRQFGGAAAPYISQILPLLFVESRALRQEAAETIGQMGYGNQSELELLTAKFVCLSRQASTPPATPLAHLVRAIGYLGPISLKFLARQMNETRHPAVRCEAAAALSGLVSGERVSRVVLVAATLAYLETLASALLWMNSEDEWCRRISSPQVTRTVLKCLGRLGRVPDDLREKMLAGMGRAATCGNWRVAQSARKALARHGALL